MKVSLSLKSDQILHNWPLCRSVLETPFFQVFLCISSLLAFASASGFAPAHLGYATGAGPIVAGGIISEQIPNEFKYAVADSYTGTQYARGESADGAGNRYATRISKLEMLPKLCKILLCYPQQARLLLCPSARRKDSARQLPH